MDNLQELQSVDGRGMKKSARTTETEVSSEAERDAQALARLGKKPILKVGILKDLDVLLGSESDKLATFYVPVNVGLYVHNSHHMGSRADASGFFYKRMTQRLLT